MRQGWCELQLSKAKVYKNSLEAQKIYAAKKANLEAAITCNHKKGIDPKNPAARKALEKFEESISKKKEAIAKLKVDIASQELEDRTAGEATRREARKVTGAINTSAGDPRLQSWYISPQLHRPADYEGLAQLRRA